jgi:hypothetical protein
MVWLYMFEWDELLMLCMGFAGIAYIVADFKRERALEEIALQFSERLARLETVVSGFDDRRVDELITRLATVEARIDYQPVHATVRRRDGKFAKANEKDAE